jgi:hypothetical protein
MSGPFYCGRLPHHAVRRDVSDRQESTASPFGRAGTRGNYRAGYRSHLGFWCDDVYRQKVSEGGLFSATVPMLVDLVKYSRQELKQAEKKGKEKKR